MSKRYVTPCFVSRREKEENNHRILTIPLRTKGFYLACTYTPEIPIEIQFATQRRQEAAHPMVELILYPIASLRPAYAIWLTEMAITFADWSMMIKKLLVWTQYGSTIA
jgi:hypothetical protein